MFWRSPSFFLRKSFLCIYTLLVIGLSLMPSYGEGEPFFLLKYDKFWHFVMYAGLSALICWSYLKKKERVLGTFLAIALGFLLEWGQSFVPGRFMSLNDGLANTAGVLVAWTMVARTFKR